MCQFETPLLVIYSYISVIILSLITAFSILYKNKKHSLNWNAFYFIFIIALWTAGALAQWLVHDIQIIFLFFRLSYLLVFFFLFFLYFSFDFVDEKLSQKRKIIFALPFLVTVFSVIGGYGIGSVEPKYCDYTLGWLAYYNLFVGLAYSVGAIIVLMKKYKQPLVSYKIKLQIGILILAISFFILWNMAYEVIYVFSLIKKTEIEISPYCILGNLFFIILMIFNIIEYDLFDFDITPGKWFAFSIFSIIFLGMFFLSLTPTFYLTLLIVYIAVIWVFWGK
ncbi:MAG: histidine kinase N-terminal 7TM domain-containing protein [Parcubacteria group bacterium]|jgi:hypothetical protein